MDVRCGWWRDISPPRLLRLVLLGVLEAAWWVLGIHFWLCGGDAAVFLEELLRGVVLGGGLELVNRLGALELMLLQTACCTGDAVGVV